MSNGHTVSVANDLAFPVLDRDQTPNGTFQLGLTKRELFAAMAMQAQLSNPAMDWTSIYVAKAAVDYADALIKALSDETNNKKAQP